MGWQELADRYTGSISALKERKLALETLDRALTPDEQKELTGLGTQIKTLYRQGHRQSWDAARAVGRGS